MSLIPKRPPHPASDEEKAMFAEPHRRLLDRLLRRPARSGWKLFYDEHPDSQGILRLSGVGYDEATMLGIEVLTW